MSLGDSVIAATALTRNLELCTNNQKDFQYVEKVQLTDTKNLIF